ncbi:MAG: hypothetical protein ABEJ23_08820 [Haloarculaceae archaeon]
MDRRRRDVLEALPVADDADVDLDLDRRRTLKFLAGGVGAVAAGKATDNVLLGYGVLAGTNLTEQDLAALASSGFLSGRAVAATASGHWLVLADGTLVVKSPSGTELRRLQVAETTPAEARAVDDDLGLAGGPVGQAVADLRDVRAGDVTFAFSNYESFFERVRAAEARPITVGLARGEAGGADRAVVEKFTGADPTEPEAVIEGLVTGFREYSGYDLERYAAGSIQDNVVFGLVDLRHYFASDVDFRSVMAGDATGMFCYEFTQRSIEALHAAGAVEQRSPVVGGSVWDRRHKHMYTAVASAIREDGDLVVPVTFVDYTHSTLYDDLHLRGVLGEGLEAYDDRHRATEIFWP